jgi:hypothetical protein
VDREWNRATCAGPVVGSSSHPGVGHILVATPGETTNVIKLVDRYLGRASILGTTGWSSLTILFVLLALMNGAFSAKRIQHGDVFWY